VTGVDQGGRSYARRDEAVAFGEVAPGIAAAGLFATTEAPPRPRPQGRGEFVDLGVAPGLCNWVVWRFEPGGSYPMHHTDTVDFDVVVEGTVELILDDGPHPLRPGDHVIVTGVDHAWRAGPQGCVISAVALGSARPG
jgi:quercetin dioxygenase-like cupin family protein